MKKFLFILILNLITFYPVVNAYENIRILDKIDLTVNSSPKSFLSSIREFNKDAICEIGVTKKGDYIPTTIRFSVSDNLNDLYDFLSNYKRPVSINCQKFKYKFLTKNNEYSVLDKDVLLFVSLCKNRVTKIETTFFLNVPVFGENPRVLKRLISEFKKYSNKTVRTEIKNNRTRNVWSDQIFKDNISEITYSISQNLENNGLGMYQASIGDIKKYSRCYLN